MRVPVQFDEAVICRKTPYSDTNSIVHLFCKDRGKIAAFVHHTKGKSKPRRGGRSQQDPEQQPNAAGYINTAIAPLMQGTAVLRPRPQADMPVLESFHQEKAYLTLGDDLFRYAYAAYLVEIVDVLLPDDAPAPDVFDWLCSALSMLAMVKPAALLRSFELKLLGFLGYLPDFAGALDVYEDPESPAYQRKITGYDPILGSFYTEDPNTLPKTAIPFTTEACQAAQWLWESPYSALLLQERAQEHAVLLGESNLRVVSRIFAAHLKRHAPKQLRSVQFFRDLQRGIQ